MNISRLLENGDTEKNSSAAPSSPPPLPKTHSARQSVSLLLNNDDDSNFSSPTIYSNSPKVEAPIPSASNPVPGTSNSFTSPMNVMSSPVIPMNASLTPDPAQQQSHHTPHQEYNRPQYNHEFQQKNDQMNIQRQASVTSDIQSPQNTHSHIPISPLETTRRSSGASIESILNAAAVLPTLQNRRQNSSTLISPLQTEQPQYPSHIQTRESRSPSIPSSRLSSTQNSPIQPSKSPSQSLKASVLESLPRNGPSKDQSSENVNHNGKTLPPEIKSVTSNTSVSNSIKKPANNEESNGGTSRNTSSAPKDVSKSSESHLELQVKNEPDVKPPQTTVKNNNTVEEKTEPVKQTSAPPESKNNNSISKQASPQLPSNLPQPPHKTKEAHQTHSRNSSLNSTVNLPSKPEPLVSSLNTTSKLPASLPEVENITGVHSESERKPSLTSSQKLSNGNSTPGMKQNRRNSNSSGIASNNNSSDNDSRPPRKRRKREIPVWAQNWKGKDWRKSIITNPTPNPNMNIAKGHNDLETLSLSNNLLFPASFTGHIPHESITRTISNWIYSLIDRLDQAEFRELEIEMKFGVIKDKQTGKRIGLPVMTETLVRPDFGKDATYFEASLDDEAFNKANIFLKNFVNETQKRQPIPDNSFRTGPPASGKPDIRLLPRTHTRDLFFKVESMRSKDPEKVRLSLDNAGKEVAQIVKNNLGSLMIFIPSDLFDVRISVNMETPHRGEIPLKLRANPRMIRDKERESFITQGIQVDMTRVTEITTKSMGDQVKHQTRELEMEIDVQLLTKFYSDFKKEIDDDAMVKFEELIKYTLDNARLLVRHISRDS